MKIRSLTAPNPGPLTLDGTVTYLLGEHTVIDPGPDIESHVDAILGLMPEPATILITHRHADHAPAAVSLSRRSGATIHAPPGVLADALVTHRLRGDDTIEIEGESLRVVATPGHTKEHVCFLTRDGDLFTGDTILGRGTTGIYPPDGDMADYLASLRKLRDLAPRTIYPAHGPVRTNAVELIDEYLAHRLERERQIVAAMEAGAKSVDEILKVVYPDLDPRLHAAAAIQIEAHLVKLRKVAS
jgi:glyoxylase-like metal-dependent hydrolase (beta-lactamase superfamily II)